MIKLFFISTNLLISCCYVSLSLIQYPQLFAQNKTSDLQKQNEILLKKIQTIHGISEEQIKIIKNIFKKSGFIGQGNPKITKHPISEEQCEEQRLKQKINYNNLEFEKICKAKFMSPLYNPTKETIKDAKVCIDQFEFPNIPCTYPVVWVRANEAAEICHAMGKRLCDAHEWEGACDGNLKEPDYDFNLIKKMSPAAVIKVMRKKHNLKESQNQTWAYGNIYQKGICATSSFKSPKCDGGNWQKCGSNTFPSGFFINCKSKFDVYDLHGNAAEHMNLPLSPEQMASHPSRNYGYTEMKGSWFIFDTYKAHEDYCRWRAPFWHGTKLMDKRSHHNYHLSFRCCKDIKN